MGKRHRSVDIMGNKLFGRCVAHGECICGNCLNAPVNQRELVMVTAPDGSVKQVEAPLEPMFAGGKDKFDWGRQTIPQPAAPAPAATKLKWTICKAHGKPLNNMHMRKCSERPAGKNGPVMPTKPPAAAMPASKGPTIPPIPEKSHTGADEQPNLPGIPAIPPIEIPGAALDHEVIIKLAGVQITIRPVEGQL